MRIANPLYDHAFKYLMANKKLAIKVISTILDEEVVDLELHQQEMVVSKEEAQFTLFRLDFKAIIKYKDGKEEKVLIELQKSKLPTNMLRFRSYLGNTYAQNDFASPQQVVEQPPYPIIAIYILGYNLVDIEVMAAVVDRKIIDASTNEELHIDSDFINLLTHKCHIVQVRRLPEKRRTRLEKFMTLFNQAWVSEQNFIIDLEEVPEEFKDIATYLQAPLLDSESRRRLAGEQEANLVFGVQEARVKQAESERDQVKEELREERLANQQLIEQERLTKEKLIRKLFALGMPINEIAVTTELSEEQIKEILGQ